mmetsp:Transcript_6309/g.10308  ORF Transcript_6309/g.10308 Transcript_6309/m.10308 type:complete len:180 (-) Transcript_6309:597-1136(-)
MWEGLTRKADSSSGGGGFGGDEQGEGRMERGRDDDDKPVDYDEQEMPPTAFGGMGGGRYTAMPLLVTSYEFNPDCAHGCDCFTLGVIICSCDDSEAEEEVVRGEKVEAEAAGKVARGEKVTPLTPRERIGRVHRVPMSTGHGERAVTNAAVLSPKLSPLMMCVEMEQVEVLMSDRSVCP